ncbi:MAG: DUF2807 domain-containing protein [Victivallales bacterium]|nr:DUF2807 domain-containing protein [Victivallales bacterium]
MKLIFVLTVLGIAMTMPGKAATTPDGDTRVNIQRDGVNIGSGRINSGTITGVGAGAVINGNGNIVTITRKVAGIDAIDISGAFELEITWSDSPADAVITLSGDANLLPLIATRVGGKVLKIYADQSYSSARKIRLAVQLSSLRELNSRGANVINLMDINTERLEIKLSGASVLKASGQLVQLVGQLSGAVKLEAQPLHCRDVKLELSGAAKADITVANRLEVKAGGAAQCRYYGNPPTVAATRTSIAARVQAATAQP